MRVRSIAGLATLVAATVGWVAWRVDAPTFPHLKHEKLVTSCASCHKGITSPARADHFPAATACASCHNGSDVKTISWSLRPPRGDNLKFDHDRHIRAATAKGETVTCRSCHATGTDSSYMAVGSARPANCIGCHAHEAPTHLADGAVCSTCHVRLADATEVADNRILGFPKPPSHATAGWASTHAEQARSNGTQCATCHTRESCARCHPNASTLDPITSLGSAPRVAKLVASRAPAYPTPASHGDAQWVLQHGSAARAKIASCANCHAQSSCRSCHTGALAAPQIAQLPRPLPGDGPGVRLRASSERLLATDHKIDDGAVVRLAATTDTTVQRSVRVHPPGFATAHQGAAASGRATCTGCHEERFCSSCHEGTSSRRFHPVNFLARHPADAYAQEKNCSTCHNTESFCRTCHVKSGVGGRGATSTTAFHTGQPVWVLQHGQAAREGMSSCTSCHQQRDCLRCHSAVGGWGVSPHGNNFDASRYSDRNKQVCLVCHANDPLRR